MNESNMLFEGILTSARQEASRLKESCERECEQLASEYESKKRALKQAEEAWLQRKQEEVNRLGEADRIHIRRENEIEVNRQLRRESEASLIHHMESLRDTEVYRSALISWIAEGIIALDCDEVTVTTGVHDTVDDDMIQRALSLVKELTGRRVTLSISDRNESSQGVVIWSPDGRIAYNNLVKTRLERCRSEFENLLEGEVWAKK